MANRTNNIQDFSYLNVHGILQRLTVDALNDTPSQEHAAKAMGISYTTLVRWKTKYNIKYYRPGRKYFIKD